MIFSRRVNGCDHPQLGEIVSHDNSSKDKENRRETIAMPSPKQKSSGPAETFRV
ncbi:hypothetical protein [Pseudonocardia yunnanensis]|jgi:hypothetical protein|uniref:Uncharacterized protein n=1 Tax=Pseudonocardia yunnanensis TaxID=58107 RepID=A0ABW4F233_9PSEU